MKNQVKKHGFTLVEMVITVGIVIVLISIVMTVGSRIDDRGKKDLTAGLMATLNTALSAFGNYGFEYQYPSGAAADEQLFYQSLKFPPDCNDFTENQVEVAIANLLGRGVTVNITGGTYDEQYSGSSVMYFFLQRVPQSRQVLDMINRQFLTNKGKNGEPILITIDGRQEFLIRIVDSWGTPLRYDYYDEQEVLLNTAAGFRNALKTVRTFPLITSAGPDREFGTADDITNRAAAIPVP
ncbi:MAG: type II secretion system protein [Phycisphaerae bacterium]